MKDVFCDLIAEKSDQILAETEHFVIFDEAKPVSPGHCLIITKAHRVDAFDLTEAEWFDFKNAITVAKSLTEDRDPDGYNIGMNCDEAAGQSQFHFHAHVIPRYKGDVDEPLGGVRNLLGNGIAPKE